MQQNVAPVRRAAFRPELLLLLIPSVASDINQPQAPRHPPSPRQPEEHLGADQLLGIKSHTEELSILLIS